MKPRPNRKKQVDVHVQKSKRDVALAMACIGGSIPPGLIKELENEKSKKK